MYSTLRYVGGIQKLKESTKNPKIENAKDAQDQERVVLLVLLWYLHTAHVHRSGMAEPRVVTFFN